MPKKSGGPKSAQSLVCCSFCCLSSKLVRRAAEWRPPVPSSGHSPSLDFQGSGRDPGAKVTSVTCAGWKQNLGVAARDLPTDRPQVGEELKSLKTADLRRLPSSARAILMEPRVRRPGLSWFSSFPVPAEVARG